MVCGLCSASYLSSCPPNKKARQKNVARDFGIYCPQSGVQPRIFDSMYMSRDQEKIKSKGVNHLQRPYSYAYDNSS